MSEGRAGVAGFEFQVLGPVRVLAGGNELTVGGDRVRTMLAALLVRLGRTAGVAELVRDVWGPDSLPEDPRHAVQTVLSRLRKVLGPAGGDLVQWNLDGYRIELATSSVDLASFQSLAAYAATQQNPVTRAELLDQALALWRGEPLIGAGVGTLAEWVVPGLILEQVAVREQRAKAWIECGRHHEAIGELQDLTAAHPLREDNWYHLMLALHLAGRSAEALASFERVRRLLVDELGADPSQALQDLHRSILVGENTGAAVREGRPVHRRLPVDISGFIGRDETVRRLVGVLRDVDGMPVVALSGSPGVGKTALAVRVAHQVRAAFPDGQWFVSLQGRPSSDVLGELLILAGVAPSGIPSATADRTDLLRSSLDGRRVLLVLDDAADSAQVEPLLPATAGNAVLVTSRQRLESLVVVAGAHCIVVDPLQPAESIALLTKATTSAAAGTTELLAELAGLCGNLPLALRIAAANLGALPDQGLPQYVEHLRGGGRLHKLALVEGNAVRAAFALSYDALAPVARRMFRILGVHPKGEVGLGAAAYMADLAPGEAAGVLGRLVNANLVRQTAIGRYALHDLLHEYAEELAGADRVATGRLLDWYVYSTVAADEALADSRARSYLEPADEVDVDRPVDRLHGLEWFEREWPNLVAVARSAEANGYDERCWQLLGCSYAFIEVRRAWEDHSDLFAVAVRAARRSGRADGLAWMLNAAGSIQWLAGDLETALSTFRECLEQHRTLADRRGEANAIGNIGLILHHLGQYDAAVPLHRECLRINREIGRTEGQRVSLVNLAATLTKTGDLAGAAAAASDSARLAEQDGDRVALALAFGNLGEIAIAQGDYPEAIRHLSECLAIASELDHRRIKVEALVVLALAHEASGDLTEARRTARSADTESEGTEPADLSRVNHLLSPG